MMAWELGVRGYSVTVFEQEPRFGGLMQTIPAYRMTDADVERDRAEACARQFDIPAVATDWQALLARGDVDVVDVVTPSHTHHELAVAALQAGKHTLVEKPMTNTTSEGRELLSLAKKQDLRLMPGHIERFNPAVDHLKTLLDEKKLGTVTLFHARRVGRWPERIGDVGVVRDTAIHDIDLARYIFKDEVNSVHARVGSVRHTKEDYAEIMLQFGSGGTAFIDANWLTPRKTRVLIVTGSEALVEIDYISQEVSIEDASQLVKPTLEKKEPLKVELSHFTESVIDKKPFKVNGQDGLKAVEICEAVLHSGTMGQTIPLTT
jgi:UDP-N-acetylglucosamine 3-dehydrogenase